MLHSKNGLLHINTQRSPAVSPVASPPERTQTPRRRPARAIDVGLVIRLVTSTIDVHVVIRDGRGAIDVGLVIRLVTSTIDVHVVIRDGRGAIDVGLVIRLVTSTIDVHVVIRDGRGAVDVPGTFGRMKRWVLPGQTRQPCSRWAIGSKTYSVRPCNRRPPP